ncbi:MAG: GTPase ObgE [Endomicrobium sp.]|jgi:GTP-binding protein|nr:GTPase ObgE [Endomicrobium sp.]
MFVDRANVLLIAGSGGNGCIAFRNGNPSGGNGGSGGSIYIEASHHKTTLLDLLYKPKFNAVNGSKGLSNNKTGKCGKNLVITVPEGTFVFKNGEFLVDLKVAGDKVLVVSGGKGGRGNFSFKNKKYIAPRIAEKGQSGEIAKVNLELKLIADVGLVGLPNAGKSTLLSRISNAKPKIAAYPFTTLVPNLGVVRYNNERFTVADIPGIINGAHEGKGLGIDFLKHVIRTKILVHVIDVGDYYDDFYENYKIVTNELEKFSKYLAEKYTIVVLNKVDLLKNKNKIIDIKKQLKFNSIFEISATNGSGIDMLLKEIVKGLVDHAAYITKTDTESVIVKKYAYEPEFKIDIDKKGVFIITGNKIDTFTEMTMFNEYEALRRYQNIIQKMGVEVELKKRGARFGDTIRIKNFEFTFEK